MDQAGSHADVVVGAFTEQAESFNRSEVANASELLQRIVALAGPQAGERWLEAACGPGIVSRALAPHAGAVLGVDATPAMVEVARREAAAGGLANLEFAVGDATALAFADGTFDGSVARFVTHHLPLPGRLFGELARVTRRGGRIVIVDHLADADQDGFAFTQEVERLRDPSHWLSLSAARLRELGRDAGLELEREEVLAMELGLEDWLHRGTADEAARALADRRLRERLAGTPCFGVAGEPGRRRLTLQVSVSAWIAGGAERP